MFVVRTTNNFGWYIIEAWSISCVCRHRPYAVYYKFSWTFCVTIVVFYVRFFLATQECKGVSSWRYYPWANWEDGKDNGQLKAVTYKKLRNDTILRVTFHSAFASAIHRKCSEYYIKFGGHECSDPAPIVNTLYITTYSANSGYWRSYPSQISGFCSGTSAGKLLAGNVQVSAHVKMSCSGGNAYTGKQSSGRVTSYLLVEEYCSWAVLCPEKCLVSVKLLLLYSNNHPKTLASQFFLLLLWLLLDLVTPTCTYFLIFFEAQFTFNDVSNGCLFYEDFWCGYSRLDFWLFIEFVHRGVQLFVLFPRTRRGLCSDAI